MTDRIFTTKAEIRAAAPALVGAFAGTLLHLLFKRIDRIDEEEIGEDLWGVEALGELLDDVAADMGDDWRDDPIREEAEQDRFGVVAQLFQLRDLQVEHRGVHHQK